LEGVIPEMFWMTFKAKRKIANSFKVKEYQPNQIIMREGDKAHNVQLIREGECVLYSSKNPLQFEINDEGKVLYNSDPIMFGQDKGYLSSSMLKFQVEILGPGAWIGDQIVLDSKRPRIFSVVATNKVRTLQIELKDFFLRMPSDYVR
jgi:CRP-like cAMP-binding protein